MIQAFSKFVEIQVGLTLGTDLFSGYRPQNAPVECDVILESASGGVHFDLPDRGDIHFQIISRAKEQLDARARAWKIFRAIHGTAGWTLPVVNPGQEYVAMVIEAMGTPQWIGQDDERRHEYSTNYIARIRDK
jgi:hypothetical protein